MSLFLLGSMGHDLRALAEVPEGKWKHMVSRRSRAQNWCTVTSAKTSHMAEPKVSGQGVTQLLVERTAKSLDKLCRFWEEYKIVTNNSNYKIAHPNVGVFIYV